MSAPTPGSRRWIRGAFLAALFASPLSLRCSSEEIAPDQERIFECVATASSPPFLLEIGCSADFELLASTPLDASIPGARSVKTVVDRADDDHLYFQDSKRYPIHWDFASAHLSGGELPVVPLLGSFNSTEYSSPSRRFLLGAVTHYEGPNVYAYEIAPYDSATKEMILTAFRAVEAHGFFGKDLRFFAGSDSVEATVEPIRDQVRLITQEELFSGIDYQPLNIAESYGRLRFLTKAELETEYLSFQDIVVLDEVPNDISVVMGIITEQFQTPLSHVNVLSRNRGTPNMALRGASTDLRLRALEGKWVRFAVGPTDFEIEEVDQEKALAWWEAHKPSTVQIPGLDDTITELVDAEAMLDLTPGSLYDAIKAATRAFGGKAAHMGALSHIAGVPTPKAFAVPVFYYLQFMEENGFRERVQTLLEDPGFQGDPAVRDAALAQLRTDMKAAPLNPSFLTMLIEKLESEYPGVRMRFRSSTNAEDLDEFTGAGLYTSKSGELADPLYPVEDAVREVWASVWRFRAFEERSYRSIDHLSVAMALLVHRSFPDEEANGVALTNNPFDPSGLEPAFYVNVQLGEVSVVQPPPGVTTDSFLYYFDRSDQPMTHISHSNLVPEGSTVLSRDQVQDLAVSLDKIRSFFAPAYGRGRTWWAMDVEFKFEGLPGETPALYIKQARPYR